jgi:hypothetical protein
MRRVQQVLQERVTQSVDAETHHVAGFQKFRLRLEAQADAGRRAGDDDRPA